MPQIVCFGEVLWDLLPAGSFLGGAPFNVAYQLSQLGQLPRVLSSVGNDELGKRVLSAARAYGLRADGISVDPVLPTGTVKVSIDAGGQPSYIISDPVAWDRIPADRPASAPLSALVYGSLALRHDENRTVLRTLLKNTPQLKVCDLNLRAPYDDLSGLEEFYCEIDVLKLNSDEAKRLLGEADKDCSYEEAAEILARRLKCKIVCVTLGADGAVMWDGSKVWRQKSPNVAVRDTIGAGDAFTAAFLDGLVRSGSRPNWDRILSRACALGSWVAGKDGAQPDYRSSDLPDLKI